MLVIIQKFLDWLKSMYEKPPAKRRNGNYECFPGESEKTGVFTLASSIQHHAGVLAGAIRQGK